MRAAVGSGSGAAPPAVARRRRWRRWALVVALLAAYPGFVLAVTYTTTLRSGLPGGRHGPCDAYRHCLASAIVAFTLSPRVVEWVTAVMEGDDAGASHRMDAHNNAVGLRLAASAADWSALLRAVRSAVERGSLLEDSSCREPDRVVWLPPERWRERWW